MQTIGLIGPHGKLGKAIQSLTPVFPIEKNTSRQNLPCDVLIDVSSKEALLENLSAEKPIVIATTGHESEGIIIQAAEKIPIFLAPNLSFGAFLFKKIAFFLSDHLEADVDLVEKHHKSKKDTPSGTAIDLLKRLKKAKVHSMRTQSEIKEHTLFFEAFQESLSISHQVHSSLVFARGALKAAEFLLQKPAGLYTMDNLFEEIYSLSL